jgi:hypothetical protein
MNTWLNNVLIAGLAFYSFPETNTIAPLKPEGEELPVPIVFYSLVEAFFLKYRLNSKSKVPG